MEQGHPGGVGAGAAKCTQDVTLPIAAQYKDQPATHAVCKANVATGSGEHLPAMMGLYSAEE